MKSQLKYLLALSFVKGIGIVKATQLIEQTGSAKDAFFSIFNGHTLKLDFEEKMPSDELSRYLEQAEKELEFCKKNQINISTYYDENYPLLLKKCADAPLILFSKGNPISAFNKNIAIVGTRKMTKYGQCFLKELIESLKGCPVNIISGLAYGCDIEAQKLAVDNGIPTWAVLANSLNRIYPTAHLSTAQEILNQGGWVSEYPSFKQLLPEFFVSRNRIIAGMSHITIVIESSSKGGSLVTANYAKEYNRPVFALPGRINDPWSIGCNLLIKKGEAQLLDQVQTISEFFKFNQNKTSTFKRFQLTLELPSEESELFSFIQKSGKIHLDQLSLELKQPTFIILPILLKLELKQLIKSIPGNYFDVF